MLDFTPREKVMQFPARVRLAQLFLLPRTSLAGPAIPKGDREVAIPFELKDISITP